jgi:glutamate-1-semialdehyde 2,1-aminomutase
VTEEHGALLIFDEVLTGFRHEMGGIQTIEDVDPDLTTLAKAIGNGYPISALMGKAEYMDVLKTADGGSVHFGGTYNAHPSGTAAVLETLRLLEKEDVHRRTSALCDRITAALEDLIEDVDIDAQVKSYGSTFLTYFTDRPLADWEDVLSQDEEKYTNYRWAMVDNGVLMVPKNARRNFITASHTEEDAQKTIEAAEDALRSVSD